MCKGHRLIAGGGSGNSALVWDVESMKLVSKLPSQDDSSLRYQGLSDSVSCLKFSPSGEFIAMGTLDGTLCICDPLTGRELVPRRWYEGSPIEMVHWIRDGTYAGHLLLLADASVYIVDPHGSDIGLFLYSPHFKSAMEPLYVIGTSTLYVVYKSEFDGSNLLVTIQIQHEVQIQKCDDQKLQGCNISCCAIDKDASIIAFGREDGKVILFSTLKQKPIQELYCDIDYPVTAISFPEKSKFVAAGYANGVIAVFDVKLGFTRYTVTCSETPVVSLLWIDSMDCIVSGHRNGSIVLIISLSGEVLGFSLRKFQYWGRPKVGSGLIW